MFAGRRKMRSIRDTSNHISRVRVCQSIPGCDKSNSSPLEWARFHSPKIIPAYSGDRAVARKASPSPPRMRCPSVSIRRDRHTNRRAGRSALRSPPDPPGVGNNHHGLECASQRSAEAIGEDPLEGRARLGLVVIVPMRVVPAPLSVTWSAVGAKTSDLDGRSIARLKMLSCVREQTPPSGKGPKLLRPGNPGKPLPSPIASTAAPDSMCRSQDHDSANLPTTATSFKSSWV